MSNAITKIELPQEIQNDLDKLDILDRAQLDHLGKKVSEYMIIQILKANEAVQKAKEQSEKAQNMTTEAGWFEFKTTVLEKRQNAVAEALATTNEAVDNLNILVNSAIGLTKLNFGLSSAIQKYMSDSFNGQIVELAGSQFELTEESKKHLRMLIDTAEEFVKSKEKLDSVDKNISTLESRVGTNEGNIEINKGNIETNKSNIAQNASNIGQNRTDIDVNAGNIQRNSDRIDELYQKSSSKLTLSISVIAIILSIISLGCSVFTMLNE